MRVKILTMILLVLCGAGIGWLAFENLMWAVWGKQNRWFEYVGFWGCPIMVAAGLVAIKSLRLGTLFGGVGFVLMLFYLGPALINTIHEIVVGKLVLKDAQVVQFVLILAIPMITLVRLVWNVKTLSAAPPATGG